MKVLFYLEYSYLLILNAFHLDRKLLGRDKICFQFECKYRMKYCIEIIKFKVISLSATSSSLVIKTNISADDFRTAVITGLFV